MVDAQLIWCAPRRQTSFARVAEGYERVTKIKPEIYITTAANGAEEVE